MLNWTILELTESAVYVSKSYSDYTSPLQCYSPLIPFYSAMYLGNISVLELAILYRNHSFMCSSSPINSWEQWPYFIYLFTWSSKPGTQRLAQLEHSTFSHQLAPSPYPHRQSPLKIHGLGPQPHPSFHFTLSSCFHEQLGSCSIVFLFCLLSHMLSPYTSYCIKNDLFQLCSTQVGTYDLN